MEKKQIKAKYIVVKQPDDNVVYRNNIRFIYIYIVITREELSKKIDNYLDGKIKRTAGVYAPLDLFAHLAKRRKRIILLDAMIVKDGELWIALLVICVILLKINLILN